jgi:hypothetical protein
VNISIKQIEILEKVKNKSSLPFQSEDCVKDIECLISNQLITGCKSMHAYENLEITSQGNEYLALLESYVEDIFKPDPWLESLPKYIKIPLYTSAYFGAFMILIAMAHELGFSI